jgi:hypothetical protein
MQIVGRRTEISDVVAPPGGVGRLVCIAHGRELQRARIAALIQKLRALPFP